MSWLTVGCAGTVAEAAADLAEAERLLPGPSSGRHARATGFTRLAEAHLAAYRFSADQADLEAAIEAARAALVQVPEGVPLRDTAEYNLAVMLSYADNRLDHLDEALQIWERQRARSRSVTSRAYAEVLGQLGTVHCSRARLVDDVLGEIAVAVELLAEAVRLLPPGRVRLLFELTHATALVDRAAVGDSAADLAQAEATLERLLATGGDVPGFDTVVRTNLESARQQRTRFGGTGQLSHPEELPVDPVRSDAPLGQQSGPARHDLTARRGLLDHLVTGRLSQLDNAVAQQERAAATAAPGDPQRAAVLVNLAVVLRTRARSRGRGDAAGAAADLDRGVAMAREAVAAATPLYRQDAAAALGTCLIDRFVARGNRADLDEGIHVLARGGRETGARAGAAETVDNALADGLLARALADGSLADLERAVELKQRLRVDVPPDTGNWLIRTAHIAQSQLVRALATGTPEHADAAAHEARQACTGLARVSPVWTFQTASQWGRLSWTGGRLREAAEAYGYALAALHDLTVTQVAREDKETVLAEAAGVAQRAAYGLVVSGQPTAAAVALENGRALLLNETLDRTGFALAGLRTSGHGALLDRYRAATDEVALAIAELASPAAPASETQTPLRRVSAARARLDAVVTGIQRLPEYAGFLRPATAADLDDAAGPGPVLYLAATDRGGIAALVPGGGRPVRARTLPKLTHALEDDLITAHLGATAADDGAAALAVCARLWTELMAAAVDLLDGAETVTLVPTGPLGLLPLHAAARRDPSTPTGWRYLLDDLTVSYTPNARALGRARRIAATAGASRLLAVAEPAPVQLAALPTAAAEVAAVRAGYPDATVLAGPDATVQHVLSALPDASVYHLACHAEAQLADPLASGLLLAGDQRLTVADLQRQAARCTARLAVLSACHTAAYGRKLPDEVVGLATGLIEVGVAGVVASQWATPDVTAFLLAVRFHRAWAGGPDPAAALRAAQRWVRDSTNAEKRDAFPDRPELAFDPARDGPDESAWAADLADANPLRWAPFAFFGV